MPGPTAEQDAFVRQLSEWGRRMSAASGISPSEGPAPDEAGDASGRAGEARFTPGDGLSDVSLRCIESGLRLWTRSAEVWMKLGLAVFQSASRIQAEAGGEDARSLLIAEIRAAVRELTRVSSQEARRLEAELEKLARSDRRDAPGDEPGPYWRRWEVKP
jgi:hypothetical protein